MHGGEPAGGVIYNGKAFVVAIWMVSDMRDAEGFLQYHGMYIVGNRILSVTPSATEVSVNKFASTVNASLSVQTKTWRSTARYVVI